MNTAHVFALWNPHTNGKEDRGEGRGHRVRERGDPFPTRMYAKCRSEEEEKRGGEGGSLLFFSLQQ